LKNKKNINLEGDTIMSTYGFSNFNDVSIIPAKALKEIQELIK
jgi:hypothetical protein